MTLMSKAASYVFGDELLKAYVFAPKPDFSVAHMPIEREPL